MSSYPSFFEATLLGTVTEVSTRSSPDLLVKVGFLSRSGGKEIMVVRLPGGSKILAGEVVLVHGHIAAGILDATDANAWRIVSHNHDVMPLQDVASLVSVGAVPVKDQVPPHVEGVGPVPQAAVEPPQPAVPVQPPKVAVAAPETVPVRTQVGVPVMGRSSFGRPMGQMPRASAIPQAVSSAPTKSVPVTPGQPVAEIIPAPLTDVGSKMPKAVVTPHGPLPPAGLTPATALSQTSPGPSLLGGGRPPTGFQRTSPKVVPMPDRVEAPAAAVSARIGGRGSSPSHNDAEDYSPPEGRPLPVSRGSVGGNGATSSSDAPHGSGRVMAAKPDETDLQIPF